MNKQKNYLTYQIDSLHLKYTLRKKHHMFIEVFPFHLIQYTNTEFMSMIT